MEKKFYDLDIPLSSATPELIARLLDAEYTCFCLTKVVSIDEFDFSQTTDSTVVRKKTKAERQDMRAAFTTRLVPPSSTFIEQLLESAARLRSCVVSTSTFSRPRVFTRVTLLCENANGAGLFFRQFADNLNSFDIVSFCPLSPEALLYVCDSAPNLDLVTADVCKPASFRITNKQCSTLRSRGLKLELQMLPMLRGGNIGSTARCGAAHFITHLTTSFRESLSCTLVISSGATSVWEVRRPRAQIALLQCLGIPNFQSALACVTKNPCEVLKHGLSRSRTAFGASTILQLLPIPNVIAIKKVSCTRKRSMVESEGVEQSNRPPAKKRRSKNVALNST